MTIHLTLTGIHAGDTLCGTEKHLPDTRYVHAAYAPSAMFLSVDLCDMCAHIWECESDACFKSDHEQWEIIRGMEALF